MELPSNFYQRLTLLADGKYVQLAIGEDIPGCSGDPIQAIFLESATVETEVEEGGSSFATHESAKYLIFTRKAFTPHSDGEEGIEVYELLAASVVIAARVAPFNEVLQELTDLFGPELMQHYINKGEKQRPQPQQTSAAG